MKDKIQYNQTEAQAEGCYRTGQYKVFALQEGERFTPDGPNTWKPLDMPLEQAFGIYGNKRSLMLRWENDEGIFCSHVFPTKEDKVFFTDSLADIVYKRIVNLFMGQLNKLF